MNQDLISRQEAIEEIVKRLGIRDESYLTAQEKSVVQVLRDMPSAQPEKMQLSTEKTQLSEEDATKDATFDYIDRQAAIDALCDNCDDVKAVCAHFPCKQCIAIEQLPSAQQERLTDDDFETIRIHLNAYKESLGNQHRWEEAEEYQRIIDRFMAFASAQPELIARDIATIIENEQDMRVILKNAEHTETHSCDYQRTETHDLVSRRAAIDALKDRYYKYGRFAKLEELVCAIEKLPSTQPESRREWYMHGYRDAQRWIPVTEALPEKPFGCLVTVMDTEPMTMEEFENLLPYFVGYDGEQWNDWEGEQCPFEVLAWIPLPEPYKEGQDE